jgi:flagellar motor switch protein FliM
MENILTQEEIDALLKGISSGDIPTASHSAAAEARPYDLTRYDRIVQGKIPAVEVMTDRFAHHLMGTFTSAFRRMVEVTPASSEVKQFREFLRGLPMPTSIHIFRIEPLNGKGLLVLEANLVYLLIEFILGGTWEGQVKIEGRDFTNIENRLIQRLVKEALQDLDKAWNVLQPVKVEFERSEINPQFAAVMLPSDKVLTIHIDVEMETASGTLILCLPFAMVEPFKDKLPGWGSDQQRKERPWMEHILGHLSQADVTISVELGNQKVTVEKILNLQVGDLLPLDRDEEGLLPVKVEGVRKFWARPGHSNGRKAVKIAQIVNGESPQEGAWQDVKQKN